MRGTGVELAPPPPSLSPFFSACSQAGGYEAALDPFLAGLWAALRQRAGCPPLSREPEPAAAGQRPPLPPPKLRVEMVRMSPAAAAAAGMFQAPLSPLAVSRAAAALDAALAAAEAREGGGGDAAASAAPPSGDPLTGGSYGPGRPFIGRVLCRRPLTSAEHRPAVTHIEVDVGPLRYGPGDALAVLPPNPAGTVAALAARLGLPADALVLLQLRDDGGSGGGGGAAGAGPEPEGHAGGAPPSPSSPSSPPLPLPWWSGPWPLLSLLGGALDVAGAPLRRFAFEVLSHFAAEAREADKLAHFAGSAAGRGELWEYAGRERRTLLEVLEDFPSAAPPLEWLLQVGPRLRPRLFSIASAPSADIDPQQSMGVAAAATGAAIGSGPSSPSPPPAPWPILRWPTWRGRRPGSASASAWRPPGSRRRRRRRGRQQAGAGAGARQQRAAAAAGACPHGWSLAPFPPRPTTSLSCWLGQAPALPRCGPCCRRALQRRLRARLSRPPCSSSAAALLRPTSSTERSWRRGQSPVRAGPSTPLRAAAW